MVEVPAGRFVMGAAAGEEDREALADPFRNRSRPLRTVAIKRFAAGKFEVTRAQYRAFVEATAHKHDGCFTWTMDEFRLDPVKNWRDAGFTQNDLHPAVCVSWEDAAAYTGWLSRITGRNYRLLTEAEWEYAARAGTTTARFWGDAPDASCAHANGADVATAAHVPGAERWPIANCNDGYPYTAPVGTYAANSFALHDTLGNVEEWTQDCWNGDYRGAPADGAAWMAGDCSLRVVRGGSWSHAPAGLRAAYRVGSPATIRVYTRGFRVATSD